MGKKEKPPSGDGFRLPGIVVFLLICVAFFGGGAVWNRWMQGREAEVYPPPSEGELISSLPAEYGDEQNDEPVPDPDPDSSVYALVRGQKGEGQATVLMLGGWGTVSPVLDYQPLYNKLTGQAKVIVLERPGYGWSGQAFSDRTIDNMLGDTMFTLEALGDSGPYVIVAQGSAGLEAIHMADKYPWLVSGIVFINAPPPAVYSYRFDRPLDLLKAYTYPVPRIIGVFRAIAVFMPDLFVPGPGVDAQAYASMFCRNVMSNAMRMEAHMMSKNARECLLGAVTLTVPGVSSYIYLPDYEVNSEVTRVWDDFNFSVNADVYFSDIDPALQHYETDSISRSILNYLYNIPVAAPPAEPEPEEEYPIEEFTEFPEEEFPVEPVEEPPVEEPPVEEPVGEAL